MKVLEDINLLELNSFSVEARALRLVEWESAAELEAAFGDGGVVTGPWMALGGGNNVLFVGDFNGTLVRSAARGIEVTGESGDRVFVRAWAGVDWDDFVAWSVERGLWGVENLSAIPGTVGAAPIQNIGAYGAEAKDVIEAVEYFDVPSGTTVKIAAADCGFGYRDSIFKRGLRGRAIITAVDFVLSGVARPNLSYAELLQKVSSRGKNPSLTERPWRPEDAANLENPRSLLEIIRETVIEIRGGKLPDPREIGNAGSFFKNPVVDVVIATKLAENHSDMPVYPAPGNDKVKLSAGWLIEHAGWKGRQEGNVGVHPRQALIITNSGGATGAEIVEFARRIQDDVRAKFGVELTPEVNFVGGREHP